MWSQKFRDHLVRHYQIGCLVPIKCGQKKKHTSSGVFETTQDIPASEEMRFGRATIRFTSISEQQFTTVKVSSKNKIYFRGFPLQASKSDVESVFGRFGRIQYIYFMCNPKSGRATTKMGYLIYESRHSVDHLLSLKYLIFGQSAISFEEYQSKRGKSDNGEPHPQLFGQPRCGGWPSSNNKKGSEEAVENSLLLRSLSSRVAPTTQVPTEGKQPAIDLPESSLKPSSNKCRIKTRIEDDSVGSPASSSRSLIFHFNNKRILTQEYLLRYQEVLNNTLDASNLRFNVLKNDYLRRSQVSGSAKN
jgi:hypothetical protein